jgi:hypothetical protein
VDELSCIFVHQYGFDVLTTTAMTVIVDKNIVKQALFELIQEEPELFKKMLMETVIEEEKSAQDADFEALIRKNFDRYESTFKALA